jgi:hypothetical protein
MLGFDYELRRRGFAGNSCQIILELDARIDPGRLEERLSALARQHPILRSRPAGVLKPRWKPTGTMPRVRVQARRDGLPHHLFNEPLDIHHGELVRFDLMDRTVIFTWSHALMDAKSAEYFLALVGANHLSCPAAACDWYAERSGRAGGLGARGRQAWRELERIEQFKSALPVSLATQRRPRRGMMKYRVAAFSAAEAARIRAHGSRMCGLLGDTNFHLAATMVELHRLHQRAGCASASYVLPVPVGLRPKGTRAPLFSNQVTMVLHQFLPDQLSGMEQAIAAVKTSHADYLRGNYLDAGITLAQLFRALPLPLYMRILRHELRGEICSLFFGDTGTVDPALERFLDARIERFAHVPAVTVPPGAGVVFYRFGGRLLFTLVYAEDTLTDDEAIGFVERLRDRLLDP